MNTHPSRTRGRSSAGQAAVFFLSVWLIAAAITAVPVVLLVRDSGATAAPTRSEGTAPGQLPVTPSGRGTATATGSAQAPRNVTLTVANSCGADGKGDCFVTIRARATSDSTDLGRLTEGTSFTGRCWASGESVRASASGVRTSKWVRLTDGNYVSGAFVSGLDELSEC